MLLFKKIFLILFLLLSVNANAEGMLFYGSGEAVTAIKAPDFELQDASGKTHRLADFAGKPLILHFWATWCPYCKRVQPGLEKIYQQHKKDGLEVMGISFNEEPNADPAASLLKRGITFKTLVKGVLAAINYEVRGTPTTFFINRKGNIVAATHASNPDDPKLAEFTAKILAK